MSIIEDLEAKAEFSRETAQRHRDRIESLYAQILRERGLLDSAEEDAAAAMAAANILRHIGFTVAVANGVVTVSVDPEKVQS